MLTLIEGGSEVTEALKPKLVKNVETGQICMLLSLGRYEATLPLPEHLAGASPERLQAFFDAVVPEMTENLRAMAAQGRRKDRRKEKAVK